MDGKKCVRSTSAYMPSGITVDRYINNKYPLKKEKQRPSREKKCQGDILYLQNPLFKNGALYIKDNSNNCKVVSTNYEENNINDNYFHRFFAPIRNFQDSQIARGNNKKSRKDGMKARAENRRRDILIDESSDEDYSSINSSNDLKSPIKSHRNSSNMDDACNKRSRAARTERYFRRLSREDNFHDYDSSAASRRSNAPKKIQDVKLTIGKCEAKPLDYFGTNSLGDRSPDSLFINQNDTFLSNPIYRTSRVETPMFYNKQSRKEMTANQTYGANIDYNKIRISDPGSEAILAYEKNKSPRAFNRLQYIEPRIFNYEQSQQIFQQNKPAINPRRVVRRSFSFQDEIPKEYENRNNFSVSTTRTASTTQVSKSGNNNFKNEDKGIDTILRSASPTPDLNTGDFQRRKLYSPKERIELKVEDKNLTPLYDPNSSNLLSAIVTDDQMPIKKRSSKDLGKELSELEEMYTSLRLSDDNLLERAEERCVEELSLKSQSQALRNELSKYLSSSSSCDSIAGDDLEKYSQQSSEAHVKNDDMAYRKMQSKKMPALSETQNSLSQISYLLASSALILGETEYPDVSCSNVAKEEPNITKDDMVYRNLHYTNNVLKVIDPQPPFGIPLRPATPSTNSNYLCSSPVALKSPPLKFIPQSEPNLITDDLAFRNLRKDAPKTPPNVSEDNQKEVNPFSFSNNDLDKSLSDDKFCRKKKKAVRSLSANLYGLIKEVNNLELNIK